MSFTIRENIRKPGNRNHLSGLNDIVQDFVNQAKAFLGVYWEKNINSLTFRINWNKGFYSLKTIFSLTDWSLLPPVKYEQVEKIVACYINLVKGKVIPEYNRKSPSNKDISYIEDKVAEYYGQSKELVKVVLYELYWATKDNTLSTDEFLRPITYAQYCEYKEKPGLEGEKGGDTSNFFEDLVSAFKVLFWVLVISGTAFGAWWLYNNWGMLFGGKK